MDIFSTRELATGFWAGILLIIIGIVIIRNEKIRIPFLTVLKCFFDKKLRKLWEIYILYVSVITFLLSRLKMWENIYLKDITIWVLFSGLTICMNAVGDEADEKYIFKILKDNIKITMVEEFLLSTFTFSIWVELAIIPTITFIMLIDIIAEHKKEMLVVHKLLQSVLAFLGLCLLLQTVKVGIQEYQALNIINTLVSFFIPIIYLLLVTPLEWAFELYSKYEMLFIRMSFKTPSDEKIRKKRNLKVTKICGMSIRKIMLFQKQCVPQMYVLMPETEFDLVIKRFKDAYRQG